MAPKKKQTQRKKPVIRHPRKLIQSYPKSHRRRPGTVALREIRKIQNTVNLLIPKAPFERLVRELVQDYMMDLRFTKESVNAIQVASEDYLTEIFRLSNIHAIGAKRVTIKPTDMQIVREIRGDTINAIPI